MKEVTQIRKLSLWIFFIPLIAINLCLIISQNPEFLDNTIFVVDQIGRSGFSIPYFDAARAKKIPDIINAIPQTKS